LENGFRVTEFSFYPRMTKEDTDAEQGALMGYILRKCRNDYGCSAMNSFSYIRKY